MRKISILCALLIAAYAPSASALVLWNLNNSANQSDPGTGVPWNSSAKVVNSDGSLLSGSAVYLGDGYFLTANHVTMDLTYSSLTFDGTTFFSIDPTFNDGNRTYGKQVAAGLDLAVFKLTSTPSGVTNVTMLGTGTELFGATNSATHIGWGVGRDLSVPLASTNVTWGDITTSAKRWGLNAPRDSTTISYNGYSYDALITYAGTTRALFLNWRGLGDDEDAATLYDSGSGLYQQIGGQWYLIGIAAAVEQNGTSTYGDDRNDSGDTNYYVRISSYKQDIVAVVPEPTTIPLLALGGLALILAITVRKRQEVISDK